MVALSLSKKRGLVEINVGEILDRRPRKCSSAPAPKGPLPQGWALRWPGGRSPLTPGVDRAGLGGGERAGASRVWRRGRQRARDPVARISEGAAQADPRSQAGGSQAPGGHSSRTRHQRLRLFAEGCFAHGPLLLPRSRSHIKLPARRRT